MPFRGAPRSGQETADTWTLELAPAGDGELAFAPGQFTMLSAFGAGEVPISISGDPERPGPLVHTVRAVGLATGAICARGLGRGARRARPVRPSLAGRGAGRIAT